MGIGSKAKTFIPKQKIKHENATHITDTTHITANESWNGEKQGLINKIVDLKAENQHITLELKKKIAECENHVLDRQRAEQILTENVKTLELQLKTLKSEMSEQKLIDEKTISDLKCENRSFQARIKQIRTGFQQNIQVMNDVDDNVYEVERLKSHKKKKDGMYYQVQWKNYSEKHNTWEHEKNLMCPEILADYKQKMNIE